MIVISGALVLVALVLLLIGLLQPDLAFVYASILVSLVSFGFLIRGVLQRRGETFGDETDAPTPDPEAARGPGRGTQDAAVPVALDKPPVAVVAATEVAPQAAPADVVETVAGTVLVVAGRPRYHVSGCRYLSGREADEIDVADAREKGFTACGVCKPDLVLERARAVHEDVPGTVDAPTAALGAADSDDVPEVDDVPEGDDVPDVAAEVEPTEIEIVPAARRATRRTAPPTTAPAPVRETGRAPAKKAPAKKSAVSLGTTADVEPPDVTRAVRTTSAPGERTTRTTPATPAKKATTVSAAKAAAAAAGVVAPTGGAAAGRGSVVVIPDRGRFHTSDCRYVRGVAGAQVLSRTAATRAGYDACGVCKP